MVISQVGGRIRKRTCYNHLTFGIICNKPNIYLRDFCWHAVLTVTSFYITTSGPNKCPIALKTPNVFRSNGFTPNPPRGEVNIICIYGPPPAIPPKWWWSKTIGDNIWPLFPNIPRLPNMSLPHVGPVHPWPGWWVYSVENVENYPR